MKFKKAFITGVTGFVGSHMTEFLLEKGIEVHGLKRWRSPMENIELIKHKIKLYNGDIRDPVAMNNIIKKIEPDVIFHLAAQSYVPYSFENPHETITTNINGTINLLEAIRNAEIDPVIHICSSSEVYGQVTKKDIPITEECPLRPQSPYGVSKVGEDMVAYQYFRSYGLKTIRTRMFTHTGPRRYEVFVVSAFAKQIAMIEAGIQEPIIKVGNLKSIRTFADVRDAVNAYWLLVNKCPPGEVYNIGGEVTMTIGQMLKRLLALSPMKKRIVIEVDPELLRPSDVTLQIPSSEKFKKATGWEPKISFDDTLEDILEYWREKFGVASDPGFDEFNFAPIPKLTGKAAEKFMKEISKPVSKKKKKFLKECVDTYEKYSK